MHRAIDQELADAAAYVPADAACAATRLQHISAWNDVVAAILKLWRRISLRNSTPSTDAYLLEEQSCQISFRSDLKRRSLRFFEDVAPTRKRTTRTTRWTAIWDQFL